MTVTRNTETVPIIYTDVDMCVITEDGLCQITRDADGTRHLDTFSTDYAITVSKAAKS